MTGLTKVVLDESEIPQAGTTSNRTCPKPSPPVLHPGTHQPVGRHEGILQAPEPTHAIASAVREARRAREAGEETVILTALCGHGHFDMSAYEAFLNGTLEDFEYPSEKVAASMERNPVLA